RELWEMDSDDDTINAAIQKARKDVSLPDALAELREVHSQLVALIEPMTDDDTYKPNSSFQASSPEPRDLRPIAGMIYSNSANHFREHQEWIESLVSQRQG
ncbi:MAG: ClbS/DfsB family four-helix bundle protein, partial [Chloroflexia bacterium]